MGDYHHDRISIDSVSLLGGFTCHLSQREINKGHEDAKDHELWPETIAIREAEAVFKLKCQCRLLDEDQIEATMAGLLKRQEANTKKWYEVSKAWYQTVVEARAAAKLAKAEK